MAKPCESHRELDNYDVYFQTTPVVFPCNLIRDDNYR